MIKRLAQRSALLLVFTLLATSAGRLHAQGTSPSQPAVVTGGDPEPPGEPAVIAALVIAALSYLKLA